MIEKWDFQIDWELFHFLRPEWLWSFIPVTIILLLVIISNKEKSSWKKLIAPHLRPFVFSKGNRSAIIYPVLTMLLVATLMTLSIAGPTWKRTEISGAKSEAVLFIALDLSRSMMAEDVQPNRLERAKFKIKDLLDANPRSRAGLMVFAGTAHSVISICEDYNLIQHQIESLAPGVMPKVGSNFQNAFNLIDTVMQRIETPSTLMFITDELDDEKAQYFTQFVERSIHKIELMSVATPQGAQVPGWKKGTFFKTDDGKFYISARNDQVLNSLSEHPRISVTPLTLDKSDVEGIAERISASLIFKKADEESEEDWLDMGYYLVVLVLFFIALWFRKGYMVQLVVPFIFLGCTQVNSWEDLWYTKDYQGQRLYNDSLYVGAADQFEDYFRKGVALYKSGDVESAIYFFQQDSTNAQSAYNLGLSYAKLGYYDQALESFKQAADLDPEMSQAVASLEITQQQIIETDSLAKLTGEQKKKFTPDDDDQPLNERVAKGKDEELTSDTEVDELPQSGDRVTDEQETGIRKAEELTEVPDDFEAGQGQEVQDILLRQVSADPSEFLKRKFEYQFKKYYQDSYVQGENW